MSPLLTAAVTGYATAFSLILAIGAQNAFVLRQGLLREHVLAICLICSVSDALLIAAGVAGFGAALAVVGWAIQSTTDDGVILPNFFEERNIPLSNAEKQRVYRERKLRKNVTETLPRVGNKTVTREEKRREEKKPG